MFAIGEAARQSGVSIETIRYYEREGIVGKADRTPSGRRVYSQRDISELRFIKRCRDLGFGMQDARALLTLSRNPAGTCADVEAMARRHLDEVRAKIAELRKLDRALAELVGNCSAGAVSCPLLEELLAEPCAVETE